MCRLLHRPGLGSGCLEGSEDFESSVDFVDSEDFVYFEANLVVAEDESGKRHLQW